MTKFLHTPPIHVHLIMDVYFDPEMCWNSLVPVRHVFVKSSLALFLPTSLLSLIPGELFLWFPTSFFLLLFLWSDGLRMFSGYHWGWGCSSAIVYTFWTCTWAIWEINSKFPSTLCFWITANLSPVDPSPFFFTYHNSEFCFCELIEVSETFVGQHMRVSLHCGCYHTP